MGKLAKFTLDETKFREIVLYMASRCTRDPTFGAIKLNKLLYYADFAAYRQLGRPITGATYRKLSEGPAPTCMVEQRAIMIDSGEAELEKRPYFTGVQQRLVAAPNRRFNKEIFSKEELRIVDEVIAFFEGKTAREVSDFSHREPGWKLARPGETIPYETAWLSQEPPDQIVEEKLAGLAK